MPPAMPVARGHLCSGEATVMTSRYGGKRLSQKPCSYKGLQAPCNAVRAPSERWAVALRLPPAVEMRALEVAPAARPILRERNLPCAGQLVEGVGRDADVGGGGLRVEPAVLGPAGAQLVAQQLGN